MGGHQIKRGNRNGRALLLATDQGEIRDRETDLGLRQALHGHVS
jgi:hypothetical protein